MRGSGNFGEKRRFAHLICFCFTTGLLELGCTLNLTNRRGLGGVWYIFERVFFVFAEWKFIRLFIKQSDCQDYVGSGTHT